MPPGRKDVCMTKNNVSETIPNNEDVATRIFYKAKGFRGRLSLINILLGAINSIMWHGEARILMLHDNMPKDLRDAYLSLSQKQLNHFWEHF